jgi:fucose 4-O-acetylase-like acetyltransferase
METTRRPDIDWLRVFAVYVLFVFHVGKVFDPAPFYHIRNADLSFPMLVLCGFIGLWHMPLFFLLAGWSAVASLQTRGQRRFVVERARQLAIYLLAGLILLDPRINPELRSQLDLNHAGSGWPPRFRRASGR